MGPKCWVTTAQLKPCHLKNRYLCFSEITVRESKINFQTIIFSSYIFQYVLRVIHKGWSLSVLSPWHLISPKHRSPGLEWGSETPGVAFQRTTNCYFEYAWFYREVQLETEGFSKEWAQDREKLLVEPTRLIQIWWDHMAVALLLGTKFTFSPPSVTVWHQPHHHQPPNRTYFTVTTSHIPFINAQGITASSRSLSFSSSELVLFEWWLFHGVISVHSFSKVWQGTPQPQNSNSYVICQGKGCELLNEYLRLLRILVSPWGPLWTNPRCYGASLGHTEYQKCLMSHIQ